MKSFLFSFAGVCFLISTFYAQISFEEHIVFDDDGSTAGIYIMDQADMNKDGYLDVVFYNSKKKDIGYLPNSVEGFGDQIILARNVSGVNAIAAGDLDGDANVDIVYLIDHATELSWLRSDGEVYYHEKISDLDLEIENGIDLHLADLDADGDLDVLTSGNSITCALFLNVGSDYPVMAPKRVLSESDYSYVEVIDVNGDEYLDIAISDIGEVKILLNDGGNQFEEQVYFLNKGRAYMMKSGDIDQDGDDDLLFYRIIYNGTDKQEIFVYRNDGGEFVSSWFELNTYIPISDFELRDMDVDGDLDIITMSKSRSEHYWVPNEDGEYNDSKLYLDTGNDGWDMLVEDFDEDGEVELIMANGYDTPMFLHDDSSVGFQAEVLGDERFEPNQLVVADRDGDGTKEYLVSFDINEELFWFGDITGEAEVLDVLPNTGNVYEMIASNVDGDNEVEVYTTDWLNREVGVWDNNNGWSRIVIDSTITLSMDFRDIGNDLNYQMLARSPYMDENKLVLSEVSKATHEVVNKTVLDDFDGLFFYAKFQDLNKDGYEDIVYASVNGGLRVIWNNENESYSDPLLIDDDISFTNSILVRDFNNDGIDDIILANNEQESQLVYINDGLEQFNKKQYSFEGLKVDKILMYDLDNDSDLDIVFSEPESSSLVVLEYDSDISEYLDPYILDTQINQLSDFAIHDVDGDTYLDIIAVSAVDNLMAWYENKLFTSVDDLEHMQVSVRPIPALDYIEVISEEAYDKVILFDMVGNKVMESKSERVNVSTLRPGMYLLSLFDGASLVSTSKVLVK